MGFEKPTRELSIGEIISQVFRLYRARFALFFLPCFVVGLVSAISYAALLGPTRLFLTPGSPPTAAPLLFSNILGIIFIYLVFAVVPWVISTIATGMVVKSASDVLVEGKGTFRESFDFTMSRLGSLLGASILTGILIAVGALLLIIPGIILSLMFSLVVPVVVIEESNVFESLERSRKLVSNRWGVAFVLFLTVGLIVLAGSGIVMLGNVLITQFGTLPLIISILLVTLVTPIIPLTTTSLYYSMLARESGSAPPPAPPPQL